MAQISLEQENARAFAAMTAARPVLIGIMRAGDAIPELDTGLILHAGPPVTWQDMTPAMKMAVCGALVFEGKAATVEEAALYVETGAVRFAPNHDHHCAGAMAGITSASMPVFVAEDRQTGIRAYTTINEGLGEALRFGAASPFVLERLAWIRDRFAGLLHQAIQKKGEFDLAAMVAEALRRGDECHNRNKAATSQFCREIAAPLVMTDAPKDDIVKALQFIDSNDHFFLSLSIVHAKICTLAMEAAGCRSSLVTTIAGNGREIGVKTAGTGGRWFTSPANVASIKLFPGHDISEATPTMGDSYVTEVIGLGAFALAAAPAIASFIGGEVSDLCEKSARMEQITHGPHPNFRVPSLNFAGVPSGIDVVKIQKTGVSPFVNTGVASRIPGVGQIGAGMQTLPIKPFFEAASHYA